MRLLLIRHGQTPSNVLGLLDTAPPGPGLTELGFQQAAALPDVVAPHGAGPESAPITRLYASTAQRAQLTAAPLAERLGLEVAIRPGLREISAGDWEMLNDENSVRGYLGTIGRWMAGGLDERTPGPRGESGREVLQRYDSVINEIAATGVAAAALVAHGAINRFWASVRADNVDNEFGATHPLHNTGFVELDGHPDSGWRVIFWTDADLSDRASHPGTMVSADRQAPIGEPDDPFDDAIPVAPSADQQK